MDRLIKARTPVRTSFTKLANSIDAELQNDEPDRTAIEAKVKMLESIFNKLTALNDQVKEAMLDDDCTEEDLQTEQDGCDTYHETWTLITVRVDSTKTTEVEESEFGTATGGAAEKIKGFKLPKIELKKFNSDLKEWLGWWAQFKKIHEDQALHASDKFHYLLQAMSPGTEGEDIVKSYPATADNYPQAVQALKERFGRENLLLQVYIRELLNLVINNVTQKEKLSLDKMYLKLESHLRALTSLNLATADPSTWLFPLIESSLPEDTLRAWQRNPLSKKDGKSENPPKTSLDYLMEFIKTEVQSEQQISLARAGFSGNEVKEKSVKKNNQSHQERVKFQNVVATIAGLHIGGKLICLFCDKSHETEKCGKANDITLDEKTQLVKSKKGCLVCLKTGHISKNCKAFLRCPICNKRHQTVMCPQLPKHIQENKSSERSGKPNSQQSTSDGPQEVATGFVGSSPVYLGTFRAVLVNGKNKMEVRALYDPGAQRSYITNHAASKLNLQVTKEEKIMHTLFGGVSTAVQVLKSFKVKVINRVGRGTSELSVLEKDKICGMLPVLPTGPWNKELKNNKIWISDMEETASKDIDLLVGADYYGQCLTGRIHQLQPRLTAIETILGWVVMGATQNSIAPNKQNYPMTVLNLFVSEESSPEQLWSLETLGIREPGEHKSKLKKEEAVKKHFMETVSRENDGRYCVRLPWIDGAQDIPSNKKIAEKRLNSTTAKLHASGMFKNYDEIFDAWDNEGIVENICLLKEEPHTVSHYLPHRAVLKPESITTPVRPVFDASCKSGRNPSLNDCLEKGPNLLELIPSILHRFRENKIGVVSDIRKAFQMISLHEDDRNYLRFLWWENLENRKIKIFRHCRVVFGVNCSPFLLGAVIDHHLSAVTDGRREIAKKLLISLYVDNCVTSVSTVQEYEEFKRVSTELLAEAKMDLRQWESTIVEDSGVGSLTSSECGLESGDVSFRQELTSVLGYKWDKFQDTIRCEYLGDSTLPDKITKRIILSKVQQDFDPLGFLCPALLPPKIILQEAWIEKNLIKGKNSKEEIWDSELSISLQEQFREWWIKSPILKSINVPRHLNRNFINEELHIFGDASKNAYATCAFLRVESGNGVSLQLIQAKARVAPLKRMSICRLELLACTITARLKTAIFDAIDLTNVPVFLWTDSTTALAWIRRNDEWGTFVGNRVKEILTLTNVQNWRHVPGVSNPADLPSRGCTAEDILHSKWWEGPDWLKRPRPQWPVEEELVDEEAVLGEKKKTHVSVMISTTVEIPWYGSRYSSYSSNVIRMAWVLRFIYKLKKKSTERGELTMLEIDRAEKTLFRLVQSEAFPTKKGSPASGIKTEIEDGLIKVQTKLLNRTDTPAFKKPILLPRSHPLVEQLIYEEHLMNRHAGAQFLLGKLRERCWILQGRRAVKEVIAKCIPCRRHQVKAPVVPEAPLPEDRVREAKTFQITGVDLAGPLFLCNSTKAWIVLFTCAVYRAVHLEMVTSLSTEAFLYALQRFISRRGRPTTIYSDNGTNFVGANNLFKQLDWKRIERDTRIQRIQWRFNPPAAPWWGGWWERLIRSIKDLLRKSLRTSKLNEVQLQTCLCEVESIINGRPLTYITEDAEDLQPLTLAMFFQDIKTSDFPEEKCLDAGGLRRNFRRLSKMKEGLRSRFRTEYLAQLVHRAKSQTPRDFQVGEIVLVGSDNKKRHEWPLAKIEELLPGTDDHVRLARIRTSTGSFLRAIQRLYPLEVKDPKTLMEVPMTGERIEEQTEGSLRFREEDGGICTRSGRKVKIPDRLQF